MTHSWWNKLKYMTQNVQEGEFFVWICFHDCMHMHVPFGMECLVSGLWAVCKSQRLGSRQYHRLSLQLFSQLCLCLLTHKDALTLHTQGRMETLRHEDTSTERAFCQWIGGFLYWKQARERRWSPLMQPLITERISEGDGEKLHTSSWKLDDCSMCSCLTGDP